jgi:alcohol dehydrogenase class IV
MRVNLGSLGARKEDCARLADNALKTAPWVKFHPRTLDKAEIVNIYRQCF